MNTTGRGRSSSWLFLGLLALAPALGGADGTGACNGRLVPIGSDPQGTGGSTGTAGAGGSTGTAGRAGAFIRDSGTEVCPGQVAAGVDTCDLFLGYKWDGRGCALLGGCSCRGPDCSALYRDEASCVAAHAECPTEDPCYGSAATLRALIAANQSCTSTEDCTTAFVSCLSGTSCSGVHYVSRSFDQSALGPLERELNSCVNGDPNQGCPVCLLLDPPPACVSGVCQPKPPPCAGKVCGDSCSTCVPNQPCLAILQFCDANGNCGNGSPPTCP
jgi:hypothetical protein